MSISAPRRTPHRKRGLLISAAILTVMLIVGAWYISGGFGNTESSILRDTLANNGSLDPQENTNELCSDILCVEGWSTSSGNFLRFDSQGAAEQHATYLGDEGRRWKNIVLDMSGKNLSFDQKVIDILFSQHDWS
ncbi:hypothetical protein [Micrococcoides hystricis]|uniref:Uncharacterized protein n=1 Tax=Micrococcoides hystricis TaxID=1572761 RepID=A0ABV6PAL0_9MICC